ncbi:MAG: HIT domain-containing protein [Vicinamibacteria bacterium]
MTTADKTPGCVLCRVRDGQDESERLLVHMAELNFIVVNLYAYNSGHVMIATRRHVGTLGSATPEELSEMMSLARRLEEAMRSAYRPDALNLGMNLGRVAGAGVPDHIHLHVVPRWKGDTSFMTVVGNTRVIPEDPGETAARLRPFFE